ncbi:C2H2 zinc finger [Ceratobasidium sp. AG-Ba]|nr:C2H2 zinc finger [Ceratobasidium sp. AG-Ba]
MSAQFAIDPSLASGNTQTPNPTTASPSNLTKPPTSPPKNPAHYSILPAYPPIPGWGPFPGPIFAPPVPVPVPVPTYIPHPPPQQQQPWSEVPTAAPLPAVPSQKQPGAHYQNPSTSSTRPLAKVRPKRRVEPPPINPAAVLSPHYQNPGGFGGVYTPPQPTAEPSSDATPSDDHYAHSKSSQSSPLTTLTSSGRQFACGQPGCSAAFDRKSDCERHRRTHVKGAADARPFKCSRAGCEAAFDRKDALMRHERNERTHLVRQTQPGRVKRPSRKSDLDTTPRRQSTRKRKSLLPSTADMYASDDDEDYDDDDEEDHPKRARNDLDGSGSGSGLEGSGLDGVGGELDHLVVAPDQLVIDPQLDGLGDQTLQAVEAIQAALQQIEADEGRAT